MYLRYDSFNLEKLLNVELIPMIIFVLLLAIIAVFIVLATYYGAYLLIMPEGILGMLGVFALGNLILILLFLFLRLIFAGTSIFIERRKKVKQ